MIAFASLFLGLVLGNQQVELVVEPPVASVEILLDGRQLSTLSGPPWKHEVSFGASLRPHLLEAVGRGADGQLVNRARQWVNLPREPAEAALVLEGVDPARPDRARLIWRHIEYASAEGISATFDGQPLSIAGDGTMALPSYDPQKVHLLGAELRFEDGARYRAELAFGGSVGNVMDAELTGVPVRASGGVPSVEGLDGTFVRQGLPLRVVAVDKAPARVVMVIDQSAVAPLRQLATRGGALASTTTVMRAGEQLEFVFPAVEMVPRKDMPARLFTMSQPFDRTAGSFGWVLTRVATPPPQQYQRLTDAVAVAALQAAGGARPRAVVLVLGPEPRDESAYQVEEVLRYLAELRVPLLVWSTGRPSNKTISEDLKPLSKKTRWGQATDIGSINRLMRAVEGLRGDLDRQATVWVEGSYLPREVTLGNAGKRLVIVGAS